VFSWGPRAIFGTRSEPKSRPTRCQESAYHALVRLAQIRTSGENRLDSSDPVRPAVPMARAETNAAGKPSWRLRATADHSRYVPPYGPHRGAPEKHSPHPDRLEGLDLFLRQALKRLGRDRVVFACEPALRAPRPASGAPSGTLGPGNFHLMFNGGISGNMRCSARLRETVARFLPTQQPQHRRGLALTRHPATATGRRCARLDSCLVVAPRRPAAIQRPFPCP
jgi:hypothetical protein